MYVCVYIGVDLEGQPGHVPPQLLRNTHAFITFYHLVPSQYFGLPTQYFDKYTPVCVYGYT